MPFRTRYTGLIDRYRDRLPVHDDTRIISLGEGNTPLIRLHNIPKMLGKDVDIYVMINAGFGPVEFTIQDDRPISRWKRFVDTGGSPPDDCREPGSEVRLHRRSYAVQAPSIVVLVADSR